MKKKYIIMDLSEFMRIKAGDKIICRIGRKYTTQTATSDAFYNYDANEPDWEIETENGFFCWDSVYVEA